MRFLPALLVTLAVSPAAARETEETSAARTAFVEGTRLVAEARWAEALARFEAAGRAKPHAVTSYNVGACHRALGSYVEARRSYAEALRLGDAAPEGERLPPKVRAEIEALLAQLDTIVAKIPIVVTPSPARISVDGRPLEADAGGTMHLARAAGEGKEIAGARFVLEIDPGVHTFAVRRPGFADAVSTQTIRPGARTELAFRLDELPSVLRIAATPAESVVRVDKIDVGTAPLVLERPAGRHRVVIVHPGYVTYETEVTTRAGEDLRIAGNLPKEALPITKRPAFWIGVGATVLAAALVSFVVVRATATPETLPFDGGTLGWTVPASLP